MRQNTLNLLVKTKSSPRQNPQLFLLPQRKGKAVECSLKFSKNKKSLWGTLTRLLFSQFNNNRHDIKIKLFSSVFIDWICMWFCWRLHYSLYKFVTSGAPMQPQCVHSGSDLSISSSSSFLSSGHYTYFSSC